MTKRKPRFVAGRTIAKRIGADSLRIVAGKILSGESTVVEQAREIEKEKGYPAASRQALEKIMQYVRLVGLEPACKAWGTRIGGPRVEQ